jgi:hypothetical protein
MERRSAAAAPGLGSRDEEEGAGNRQSARGSALAVPRVGGKLTSGARERGWYPALAQFPPRGEEKGRAEHEERRRGGARGDERLMTALLPPSALAKGKGGVEEMELGRRPRELPWPSTVLLSSSAAALWRSSSGVRESQQLGRRRTGRGARGLGERMRSDWARRLGFRSTDLVFYMAGAERPKIPCGWRSTA